MYKLNKSQLITAHMIIFANFPITPTHAVKLKLRSICIHLFKLSSCIYISRYDKINI